MRRHGREFAAARAGAQPFARDTRASLGCFQSVGQDSFEVLGRDPIGDESSQVFKRVRVATTVNDRLR